MEVIQDFQTQIESADSQETIANILQKRSPTKVKIPESLDINNFKDSITEKLQKEETSLQNTAQSSRNKKRYQLLKKVIKYNLGALISIYLLIFVWKHTFWARTDSTWD